MNEPLLMRCHKEVKKGIEMKNINKVRLMGRIASTPEIMLINNTKFIKLEVTTTGFYFCKRTGSRVEYTDWHEVICYSGIARFVNTFVKRGSKVLIDGTIRKNIVTDSNGVTHYTTQVIAKNLQTVGSNKIDERIIFYDRNGFHVCANLADAEQYELDIKNGKRSPWEMRVDMDKEKHRTFEEVSKDPLELGF